MGDCCLHIMHRKETWSLDDAVLVRFGGVVVRQDATPFSQAFLLRAFTTETIRAFKAQLYGLWCYNYYQAQTNIVGSSFSFFINKPILFTVRIFWLKRWIFSLMFDVCWLKYITSFENNNYKKMMYMFTKYSPFKSENLFI